MTPLTFHLSNFNCQWSLYVPSCDSSVFCRLDVFLRVTTKHSVAPYACVHHPLLLHVIFVLKHRCFLEEIMQRNIPAASRSVLRVLHTHMWLVLLYTTKLVLYLSTLCKFVRASKEFRLSSVTCSRVSCFIVQIIKILFQEKGLGQTCPPVLRY